MHSTALGETMSLRSDATQRFLGHARQVLIARGMAPGQANLGAFTLLGGALKQQVMVMAFSDLFLLCTAATLLGLVPIALLKPPARRARP